MTLVETTPLEDLEIEFMLEPPCEFSAHVELRHDAPAWALIRTTICCAAPSRLMLICRPCWDVAGISGLQCAECGIIQPRDEAWDIVRILK